jgi:pilus assembly protein Flp/PilA
MFLSCNFFVELYNLIKHLVKGENAMLFAPKAKAQGLIEYALIIVLIAVVVIVVLRLLGPRIGGVFSAINTDLSGV